MSPRSPHYTLLKISHFAHFEEIIIKSSHLSDFKYVVIKISHFPAFEQVIQAILSTKLPWGKPHA